MEETRLSIREHERYQAVREVIEGRERQQDAARKLRLSPRQVRRIQKRVRGEGVKGVIHRSRGRPSSRRIPEEILQRVERLYRDKYEGFNLTHFVEYLEEREDMKMGRETVRSRLISAGLWKHRRKHPKHRLRRPRKEQAGEMMQIDGSIHLWLPGDDTLYALLGGIDDATGWSWGLLQEAETTEGYFRLIGEIAHKKGLPTSLYSDRDSIFVVNRQKSALEILRGKHPETQFARAMRELGVEIILANSPQAKGRVERLWGTFQDRLFNELRLEKISKLPQANRYLQESFLPRFNARFTIPAAKQGSLFRRPPPISRLQQILCRKETRKLASDHTFQLDGKVFQVLAPSRPIPLRGRRVMICQRSQGSLEAYHQGHRLRVRASEPIRA